MSSTGLEAELIDLLVVFIIAAGVGVFVAKIGNFPYTIALLIAGFGVSIAGIPLDIALSHDMIILVLLPPLLFEGAATTDFEEFRENLGVIMILALVGLMGSILFLGVVGSKLLGFPLLIGLLFATTVLPTDPVSVLALFKELGAPERLSVLVEGESLINDGVAVVIFSAILTLVSEGAPADEIFTLGGITDLGFGIVSSILGGVVVGLCAGYLVYRVMVNIDEHMTEIVLTFILAYGAFIFAEHYLHVSGVIATVVAGLFIGNRGADYAMSPQTKISIFNAWETAAFIVNTFIFLVIGATTPVSAFITHAKPLILAIVLVLTARALAVYPITWLGNRTEWLSDISREYQHILWWGGLHGSIPIALVLGLPEGVPHREEMRVLVFGVAAFSLVVQGLTMGTMMNRLNIVTSPPEQQTYELLVGRARAVDAALDSAEELHEQNKLPPEVYGRFVSEYTTEKEELSHAISSLLAEYPEVRKEKQLAGERQVLKREKAALIDTINSGTVSDEIGERLMKETDLKLSQVRNGKTTVSSQKSEEYSEFWRDEVEELGIDVHSVDE